mmetsp:Transcript_28814/g.70274  ORF Transcript_28814/g.70274 Transcript_28814/m.70274 type:complete len:157 (-) Transcript_28814:772-1242(-)
MIKETVTIHLLIVLDTGVIFPRVAPHAVVGFKQKNSSSTYLLNLEANNVSMNKALKRQFPAKTSLCVLSTGRLALGKMDLAVHPVEVEEPVFDTGKFFGILRTLISFRSLTYRRLFRVTFPAALSTALQLIGKNQNVLQNVGTEPLQEQERSCRLR